MKAFGKRMAAVSVGLLSLVGGIVATIDTVDSAVRRQVLKSNDLTDIRREALTLFPRGSRLQDAAARLADVGFVCEPMRRPLADVSGPAMLCASNGRGYPDYPAINVTLSTRNGLVSEIEIWNIMARSDEDTSLAGLTGEDEPRRERFAAVDDPDS